MQWLNFVHILNTFLQANIHVFYCYIQSLKKNHFLLNLQGIFYPEDYLFLNLDNNLLHFYVNILSYLGIQLGCIKTFFYHN